MLKLAKFIIAFSLVSALIFILAFGACITAFIWTENTDCLLYSAIMLAVFVAFCRIAQIYIKVRDDMEEDIFDIVTAEYPTEFAECEDIAEFDYEDITIEEVEEFAKRVNVQAIKFTDTSVIIGFAE